MIIAHINKIKNLYYSPYTQQINKLLMKFLKQHDSENIEFIQSPNPDELAKSSPYIILYDKYMDGDMLIYKFYSYYSQTSVRSMLTYFKNNWVDVDITDINVFAKRIDENTIEIRLSKISVKFVIKNLSNVEDYVVIGKFFMKNKYKLYKIYKIYEIHKLHELFHRLSFPDIYKISQNDINMLKSLSNGDDYITPNMNSTFKSNLLMIGAMTLKKIYNFNMPYKYFEAIYTNDSGYWDFVKSYSRKRKLKYKWNKSNYELRNSWIDFYTHHDDDNIVMRMYNGYKYCYPFVTLKNNTKVGDMSVIVKYLLLDIIYGDADPDTYNTILKLISVVNWDMLFGGKCTGGPSISPYKRYYERNWGKSPWNYRILLK